MNRSESKYQNTARLMDEALLLLLEKSSYEYITVKALCEKAGVNRSTFYLHYETMNDLLLEAMEYVSLQMSEQFSSGTLFDKNKINESTLDELVLFTPDYLIPYLNFVKKYKALFVAAVSQPVIFRTNEIFSSLYNEIFSPILDRFHVPEREKKYRMAFYVNGIYFTIMEWIKGGCAEDVGFIAELLIQCVKSKLTDSGELYGNF